MNNGINSFTFFRDYFNLIDTINPKDKKEILVAIVDYVFKDEEPKLKGHNLAIFNTLKFQLNVSKSNSKRRIKKESKNETEKKPEKNQKETGEEPKQQPKQNKTSISYFLFLISNFLFNKLINKYSLEDIDKLKNNIIKWVEYKLERKEIYKERGFNALLTQIENNSYEYGIDEVCDLINECMASNYKGIIFEKLKKFLNNSYLQKNFILTTKSI